MSDTPNSWDVRLAERTRIPLMCPDCGKENLELVSKLQTMNSYRCRAIDCGHDIDLRADHYKSLINGIQKCCAQFDAVFNATP